MDKDSSFELYLSPNFFKSNKGEDRFSNRGNALLITPKRNASLLLGTSFVLLLLASRCLHSGLQKHLHCCSFQLHEGLTSCDEPPSLTGETRDPSRDSPPVQSSAAELGAVTMARLCFRAGD